MNSIEPLKGIEEIAVEVNKLVQRHGLSAVAVISSIEACLLNGPSPSNTSSEPPSAYVELNENGHANLVLHVCRMGVYLAPGREKLRIPIDYRDNTVQVAVDTLFDSNSGLPTSIRLGDKSYTFDTRLKFDVYAALMDYLAEVCS